MRERGRVLGAGLLLLCSSCVLADGPPDMPTAPRYRPMIITAAVTPPPSRVLTEFPTELLVPVQLVDPKLSFSWRVFVDFDPQSLSDDSRPVARGTSAPGLEDVSAEDARLGIRRVHVTHLVEPADRSRCHLIEFVAAYEFAAVNGPGSHATSALDSDQISWFYSPNGDLTGCPVLTPGAGASSSGGADDQGAEGE